MTTINKIVRIGTIPVGSTSASVFCKISYANGKLSISGVEGPLHSGNARGACGQINTHLSGQVNTIKPAPGWNRAMLKQFFSVWDAWHLNDMQAGTPEQMAIAKGKPYTEAVEALKAVNLYEVDGYKYGSAWLTVSVPWDVLAFLENLPVTDKTPAWV